MKEIFRKQTVPHDVGIQKHCFFRRKMAIMAKSKGYKRLLVFCLLVFILCDGTSFASRGVGRCGPPAGWRGTSFTSRGVSRYGPSVGWGVTRFQPYPIIIGFPYDYQYYDYDRYYNRYDVLGRYDILYPSSQVQALSPQGNIYNYCTYNYFGGTEDSAAQNNPPAYQRQPPQKTEVGIFYGDGVTAFKNGNYAEAAKNFQRALRQANKFMPLAYTQALFADENYAQATKQLRLALDKLSPENDSILFPKFLYPSDQILLTQIEKLREQAGSDSDLQLLVGYQLFGVKKMDEAVEFLNKAKSNSVNELAATKLLLMIEKTKTTTNRSQTPAYKTTSHT
jgi:tetratricopeptide (TPR) repeat protein